MNLIPTGQQAHWNLGRLALRAGFWLLAFWMVNLPATVYGADANQSPPPQPEYHAHKLGEFAIKDFRPVQREKVKLDFTVYVEVSEAQQEQFEHIWPTHEHRTRNHIITAARLVPGMEFDDPTLAVLRRRIELRLRRALPELPFDEVFVSDFSYLVE